MSNFLLVKIQNHFQNSQYSFCFDVTIKQLEISRKKYHLLIVSYMMPDYCLKKNM